MTVNIANREKGAFPISIGTSLAIEGAIGQHPDQPPHPNALLTHDEVWFNLFTLFRNLYQSLKAEDQRAATVADLYPGLVEDILGCQTTVAQESNGKCKAVFYLNDYSQLGNRYPAAKLHQVTTDNQKIYKAIEQAVLIRLLKDTPVEIERFQTAITGRFGKALIVTHYSVDLFARYSFNALDLLESHTGKIKPASQWNSKLTGKKEDTDHLPFLPFTLEVFGDGQQFMSLPGGLRHAVMKVAKARGWTSVTTLDKVKFWLDKDIHDKGLLAQLKALL
jgi:hypothetical protein